MNQVFVFGSSSVYGVGGRHGGWADMLKLHIHEKMFGPHGLGETFEIFNFAKSGATIEFVTRTFPQQFADFSRQGTKVAIISVGGNNAKAIGDPTNYVSTLEGFEQEMEELLTLLAEKFSYVIGVGSGFYDETKVSPKTNPFNGKKSYFSNERKQLFQDRFKALCQQHNFTFVGVDEVGQDKWLKKYCYEDGLHPNHYGYELIYRKLIVELEKIFEELR